jgi:hypothetical protein
MDAPDAALADLDLDLDLITQALPLPQTPAFPEIAALPKEPQLTNPLTVRYLF